MSRRSETLARELVKLFSRYNESDFREAADLIGNGPLFEPLKNVLKMGEGVKKSKLQTKQKRLSISESEREAHQIVRSIIDRASDQKRPELQMLLNEIESGAALYNIQSLRDAIQLLSNAPIPKDRRRADLIVRLFEILSDYDHDRLKSEISQFARRKETESALQRWSDIIVKKEK